MSYPVCTAGRPMNRFEVIALGALTVALTIAWLPVIAVQKVTSTSP